MMNILKTTAVTALLATASAPAFAAAHLDVNSMTCEEYNQLSGADRDKVAVMAIDTISSQAPATAGTATDTNNSLGVAQEESNSAASSGSATDTTIANADDDLTRLQEEIGVLNRTCSRNWDATVIEAATGSAGTR